MTKRDLRELGSAGVLGFFWAALPAVGGLVLLANIGRITGWMEGHLLIGWLVYVAVFITAAGLGFLPTYAQAVLGGWVFGLAAGLPGALLGFVGGALLGYVVARTVSGDRVEAVIHRHRKAEVVRDALVGHGFWRTTGVVALLRVPPNSPFALTNLVMASSGVPLLPFALGTLVGMTPRTAVAVGFAHAAAATGAQDIQTFIEEGLGLWVLIGGIVLMLIVLAIIAHIANAAIDRVLVSSQGAAGESGEARGAGAGGS